MGGAGNDGRNSACGLPYSAIFALPHKGSYQCHIVASNEIVPARDTPTNSRFNLRRLLATDSHSSALPFGRGKDAVAARGRTSPGHPRICRARDNTGSLRCTKNRIESVMRPTRVNGFSVSIAEKVSSRTPSGPNIEITVPGACGASTWTTHPATGPHPVAVRWSRSACGCGLTASGL